MKAKQFRTIITNKNGELSGLLQVVNEESIKQVFDPLTVLGDLLNIVAYEEKSPYPQDNYSFKERYTEHPFFLNSQYTGAPHSKLPHGLKIKPFFVAFDLLSDIICNNKEVSISEFELIKQFLDLKFTFQILFEEENPLYGKFTTNPFNGEKVDEYQYVSIGVIEDFTFTQFFENKDKSSWQFVYSCSSVEEIMFSVLHYLSFFKYKFAKCNHCGNYFATKSLKQKYCKRKSPYKGYDHLQCEQAVRNIKQQCVRQQKRVSFQLREHYAQEIAFKFFDQYSTYKEAVDKCPSIENLLQLEHFLSKENIKKNWYDANQRIPSPHNNRKNP